MAPEAEQLRLLVVDDEPKLTEFLRMELEVEGYAVEVANDGASGLIALRGEPAPDLVLLDWNLPDFTGLDICSRIRGTGMTVPVLMLTGYDEVKDKVEALDAGVDDYLVKPFSIEELLARLRALQRRSKRCNRKRASLTYCASAIWSSTKPTTMCAAAAAAIQLSNKEYQLLVFLMRSPTRCSRDSTSFMGFGEKANDNLLDVQSTPKR